MKVLTSSMTIFENQFREDKEYPVKGMKVIPPVLKRPQKFQYRKPNLEKEPSPVSKKDWRSPTQFKEFSVGKRNLVLDHSHECGRLLELTEEQKCTFQPSINRNYRLKKFKGQAQLELLHQKLKSSHFEYSTHNCDVSRKSLDLPRARSRLRQLNSELKSSA